MIQGIDLKWWLLLIAFGGFTVSVGGGIIDSHPFIIIGNILLGWAAGVYTARKAALRALAQWRDERQRVMRLQPRGQRRQTDDPGMIWVRFDRAAWDAFNQEGMK